jgi:predicted RecB family nuclease
LKRITGTHVYSFVKCPRLAALDLTVDRALRRPPTEWEEFAARRGREFEARYVAGLGAVAPVYAEADFAAGAASTMALLRAGAPWIHQAVLRTDDRLGLPDLLRRRDGESALGAHHYEVLDVKTSGRPRADQILQVVFYSRLLGEVQGRRPETGALVLKDGREERFAIAEFDATAAEVEDELLRLRCEPDRARPFLRAACDGCHWNRRCLPELAAAQDLSLVQGMTLGARAILERLGCRTVADLATFAFEGGRARGQLDPTLLRRLRKAAQAALLGQPVLEPRPRTAALGEAALVHALTDPYGERVLCLGRLWPATAAGRFDCALPKDRGAEWPSLLGLLDGLPAGAPLLHFGEALPRWYEEQAFAREADVGLAARFVDLLPRLRGAALYPGPVFALADFVRHGLGRDPLRAGHPGAAALWATGADAAQKLVAKMRADLDDLVALKQRILDADPGTRETTVGPDPGAATA